MRPLSKPKQSASRVGIVHGSNLVILRVLWLVKVGLQPFQLVMEHKHLTYILALGKKDFESSGALNEVDFSASWRDMSFSMHIVFEHC
ncbi:hypothetical protein I7I53_08275 [Histoplasma capsulatum var. duboisii H88]|uniref:Uncharacterized protein n=1 Tax=Ajellomyces capsulatus (strain H88) TaxID=544711 RepID=A0A8A1LI38_AJEC8|nr:hypothetical protein I7I53_08275 [Histoplasma capsulatum var. duboisii H88]